MWGIVGANIAVCIALLVGIVLRSVMLRRHVTFGYRWADLAMVLTIVLVGLIVYAVDAWWLSVAFTIAISPVVLIELRIVLRAIRGKSRDSRTT